MRNKVVVYGVAVLALCSAFTLFNPWHVDSENSQVNFELPVHNKKGTFSNLKATIHFDENNLQNANITATIDVKTIKVGDEKQEEHLRSRDFFDADKFPIITFTSTEIVKSNDHYIAKGTLTMKDSTKAIEIPFTFTNNGDSKAIFNGTMALNGADYGVLKANRPGADKVIVYLVVPVTE